MNKTISVIIKNLKNEKDCIVFSPIYQPDSSFLMNMISKVKGNLVIISPRREALSKVKNSFFIHGGMNERECETVLHDCDSVHMYTLYISAYDFQRDCFLHFLQSNPPDAFIILNADCASPFHWDFNKYYRNIGDIQSQIPKRVPCCIFSADDSTKNIRELKNVFSLTMPTLFYPGVADVKQTMTVQKNNLPVAELEKYIRVNHISRMIVFCSSRQSAENAKKYFSFFKYQCTCVHGGMSSTDRAKEIISFNRKQQTILFTTWLFNDIEILNKDRIGFLGLPTDLYQLYRYSRKTDSDIPIMYNDIDEADVVNHIYDDADIRSSYSQVSRDVILEERKYRYALMMHFLGNNLCAYEALQKMNGDIFYESKIRI